MADDVSDGGFFLLWRRFFAHPYWCEARVFSRAEAWIDLLGLAAWEDHEVLVRGKKLMIRRGELLASVRFLAGRWKWSHGKVMRYLSECDRSSEIETVNETVNGTVYRIVKYDEYQPERNTQRNTQRNSRGTPAEQRERSKKEVNESILADQPVRNGGQSRNRMTWLTPYGEAWIRRMGGEPKYAALAKALKPIEQKDGAETVLRVWTYYLEHNEAEFCSPHHFASKYGIWKRKSQPTFSGYH